MDFAPSILPDSGPIDFPPTAPVAAISAAAPAVFSDEPKYIGVQHRRGRFSAKIKADRAFRHIGTFGTALEAALAYDDNARPLGRRLNFPTESEISLAAESSRSVAPDDNRVRASIAHQEPTAVKSDECAATTARGQTDVATSRRSPVTNSSRVHASETAPGLVILPIGPMRGMDEVGRLMAKRPSRTVGAARADEEAAIAAFVSDRGVRKCPPVGPVAPGLEMLQMEIIEKARIALLNQDMFIPGMPVTYNVTTGHRAYRRRGIVSATLSTHSDRIAIDIVTAQGVTETKLVQRRHITARK